MLGFAPLADLPLASAPEPVTESRWHQPLSDPVRTRVAAASIALIASGMATISQFGLLQSEAVTEDRWHREWSTPVRVRPGVPAHQQSFAVLPTFTGPGTELVTVDKWFAQFTERYRVKPGLNTALQLAPSDLVEALFQETVTESRWHQPWSLPPVLARSRLGVASQRVFAAPQFPLPTPVVITDALQRLVQGPALDDFVELYDLDATAIGGDVYRFTSTAFPTDMIRWNGNAYAPIPVETSGWEWSGRGTLPTPLLRVSNVSLAFGAAAIAFGDLLGATLTRTRTFRRFLDGQANADPDAHFPLDIYRIDRKRLMTKAVIEWELAAVMDQQGLYLPRRPILRNACTHRYRVFDVDLNDFVYTHATCPYAGSAHFTETGAATTDPSADHCGKRLSDCKKRFGSLPLPTRSFPGVARTAG